MSVDDKTFFAQPAGHIAGSIETTSSNPNFRWNGQPVNGDKSPEAAVRRRQTQFATIEEFAAWRKLKGFPDLNHWNLVWAWANFNGEPTTERGVANPIVEHR
jgi:hypothetical protein